MKNPRRPGRSALPLNSRFLLIALLVSIGLHVLLFSAIVLLPRLLPVTAPPREQGTIELLMVEQKGAEPGAVHQPQENQPQNQQAAPPPKADPGKEAVVKPPLQPLPPQVAKQAAEPVPPPPEPSPSPAASAKPQPEEKPTETAVTPPPAPKAPVFDLQGTDSDSNDIALGDHILPAKPDDRFRNRPPVYPMEAQMLGQHGEVVVVIHVSEGGVATGVDVLTSSGFDVLDQAAIAAVQKWRFHPAMKDGRTIPFDMPFRFVFEAK
jgi:protein TonB